MRFRALSLGAFGRGLFADGSQPLRHQRLSCITNNIQNRSIVLQQTTLFPINKTNEPPNFQTSFEADSFGDTQFKWSV
jgi:hypothetical protein